MKKNPVLIWALILTIVVELLLMALVYNKVGTERLPYQIMRFMFILVCMMMILVLKSNVGLFLLSAYHIVTGMLIWNAMHSPEQLEMVFMIYHIGIGLIIYFHDWIENLLNRKRIEDQ